MGFGDAIALSNLHLSSNGVNGVNLSGSCIVTDCTAIGHTGDRGFKVGERSVLTRVIARGGGTGIEVGQNSSLVDCVVSDNTTYGIKTSGAATLERCVANDNGTGFDGGGVFTGCIARNNSGNGFYGYGIFDQCAAWWNGRHGISAYGATVINCDVTANAEHGIHITGFGSRIVGNRCNNNGRMISDGAGIWLVGGPESGRNEIADNVCKENDHGIAVDSSLNRIADNHLVDNRVYGLHVAGQYNLIIRNTARNVAAGAVNWNIAQFNRAGAYVAPANNVAISGSTGGNGSGTTDPFANLSF